MCGIAGLISSTPISINYIKRMTDSITHRGPDDEGHRSFLEEQVWFGHRRLSILDLSPLGHQPMSYADGRYWITYNGEVYNYIELRQQLEKLGYEFRTSSDTEVILAAYAEWGKACLERFNGMWSFLIIDTIDMRLFAARDRFGVKPLYYWRSPEGLLAFASEIKEFTVLPGWKAIANGQRSYDFLVWGLSDHTEETFFLNVFQIRGGQAVELNLKNEIPITLPIYTWYELKGKPFTGDMHEAASEFRALFIDAVRLRLRADVEVGSCLSGGLDSSSIVCVMNDLLHEKNAASLQKTVSACADIKKYDEREFINEVVQSRNIDAHYVYPGMDHLFKMVGDITWHQDEPFGSTSIYAQWCVFQTANQNGLKVMLDGQGADEQLAGYHSYFAPRFAGLFKRLQWIKLYQEIVACKTLHDYSFLYAVKGIANMLLPESIRQGIRKNMKSRFNVDLWLDMEKLGAIKTDPLLLAGAKTDTIAGLSYSQLMSSNLQMLLHWEDRDSMAHSVESRLPFLDYRLVEFVLGLPDEMKLSNGITKRVLREGMQDILPEKIQWRMDKLGFVTPEEVWLKEQGSKMFEDSFTRAVTHSNGILKQIANEMFQDILDGKEEFSFWPWRVISFGNWVKRFQVSLGE